MAKRRGQLGTAARPTEVQLGKDSGTSLRVVALVAVAIGLLVLTALACVLSYPSMHALASQAGVSPKLAKLYPLTLDAMLVVAGSSVLALRGAGLISRLYAWLSLLILLAGLGAGSVVHAAGIAIQRRPAAIAAATIPWALVLIGFGLMFTLLTYAKLRRSGSRAANPGPAVAPPLEVMPATAPAGVAGQGPVQSDDVDQERYGLDDTASASVREAGADDFDDAAPAVSAQAARIRPFARPADLQLRGRVPASRAPLPLPSGTTAPSDYAPPSGTTAPIGVAAPNDAAPTGMAGASPTTPAVTTVATSQTKPNRRRLSTNRDVADSRQPSTTPSPMPAIGQDSPPEPAELAEPPALHRPRSSPTPPED